MKIRKILGGAVLAVVLALGVGVGLGSKQPEKTTPVGADGEKWIITISFNNATPETSEDWGYIDGQEIHYWGSGFEAKTVELHQTGKEHLYTVNLVFESDDSLSGLMINFYETKDEVRSKKESQNINLSLSSSANGRAYTYYFNANWDGEGKYEAAPYAGYHFSSGWFNSVNKSFTADPENARYYVKNVELTEGQYIELRPLTSVWNSDLTGPVARDNDPYLSYIYTSWLQIAETGTYDFFLTNEYKDGGILEICKHEESESSYIYYVLENNVATGDYIYSWGGTKQFGDFPGTSIQDLITADKASEITGNGVLHFQGSETPKLIYRIEITRGYPTGDTTFMFNNGTSSHKSDERSIVLENAYWWTGPANSDAAEAIDFLVTAEAYRNGATDYSVCNVDEDSAKFIVGQYNALSQTQRETYVDTTTVYTWSDPEHSGNKLWSYRDVVIQLGKISNTAVVGSSSLGTIGNPTQIQNNDTVVAVTVIVAFVSISALAMLIVIKKRKHN